MYTCVCRYKDDKSLYRQTGIASWARTAALAHSMLPQPKIKGSMIGTSVTRNITLGQILAEDLTQNCGILSLSTDWSVVLKYGDGDKQGSPLLG